MVELSSMLYQAIINTNAKTMVSKAAHKSGAKPMYSSVILPGGLEPGYYASLGLFMDGRGYIVFLSYFARGS